MQKLGKSLTTLFSKHKKTPSISSSLNEHVGEVFAHVLPSLVRNCLEYLVINDGASVVGIFGHTIRSPEVERIARLYERGREYSLEHIKDPHLVAELIKHYIRRKWPAGIVPHWIRSCFFAAGDIEDENLRIVCATKAVKLLPPSNKYVLMKICEYLHEVHQKEGINKMSAHNLALVFGNLFLPSLSDDADIIMLQTNNACNFIEIVIQYYETVFVVEQIVPDMRRLDIPVKAKACLELLDRDPNFFLQIMPKKEDGKKFKFKSFLEKRSKTAAIFDRPRRDSFAQNSDLEELANRKICEREEIENLVETLVRDIENFERSLERLSAGDGYAKEKIRKAAYKMFQAQCRRKMTM